MNLDFFTEKVERAKSYEKNDLQEIASKGFSMELNNTSLLYGLYLYNVSSFAHFKATVERDWSSVKRHFYLAGRTVLYHMKKFPAMTFNNKPSLNGGALEIILLSDSPKLIKASSAASSEWDDGPTRYEYSVIPKFMQAVIRDDRGGMEKHYEGLYYQHLRIIPTQKWYTPHHEIMRGFLERNPALIETNLTTLLQPKFHRYFNKELSAHRDYLSLPAAGWAKLAWLKGMEIEVNHPLVPKELLPVQPLAEYPEYEFMMNDPEGRLE